MSDVVLYSAEGCPLCARYRQILEDRGVPYQERNTSEDPSLLHDLARKGIRMVPTVFVDDEYVAGFRPSSLLELLG